MSDLPEIAGPKTAEETAERFGCDAENFTSICYWVQSDDSAWVIQQGEDEWWFALEGHHQHDFVELSAAVNYCMTH